MCHDVETRHRRDEPGGSTPRAARCRLAGRKQCSSLARNSSTSRRAAPSALLRFRRWRQRQSATAPRRSSSNPREAPRRPPKASPSRSSRSSRRPGSSTMPENVVTAGQAVSHRRLRRRPRRLDDCRAARSSGEYVKRAAGKREASVLGPGAHESAGRAGGARQRRQRPRDGLRRHAAVDDARSHVRPADASDHSGAGVGAGGRRARSARRARQFLEAFLTGFEVECKIAEAIDPDHYNARLPLDRHDRHVRRGGGGGEAAEAGAGGSRAHAIAIAASMSAGIRVNFGSMTKPLHAGRAAQNGVVAAKLASRGLHRRRRRARRRSGASSRCSAAAPTTDRIVPACSASRSRSSTRACRSSRTRAACSSHPSMDAMLKLVIDHDIKPDQIKARPRPRRLEHPRAAALQDREDRARGEVLPAVPDDRASCCGARPASASSPTSSCRASRSSG